MDDIINQIPFNTWFLDELEFYEKKKRESVIALTVEKSSRQIVQREPMEDTMILESL